MTCSECYLPDSQCALRDTISDRTNEPCFSSKNQDHISETIDPTSTVFPFADFSQNFAYCISMLDFI